MTAPVAGGLKEARRLVEAATGPDRELDARLWCFAHGYRFVRIAGEGEFFPYRDDVEPGPQFEGKGSWIVPGHLIYFNPDPKSHPGGTPGLHYQLMSSFTAYTSSIDAALALVERLRPREWPDILREAMRELTRRHYWHIEFAKPDQLQELPLAILSALLRALSEADAGQEGGDV